MLYDATLCIGCKACVVACAEANDLPRDVSLDGLHQAPEDLNAFTKNIIKLYKPQENSPDSFVKQQCMHCLDPACVAACPFKALWKNDGNGVVAWEPSRCIGCRYCEIACPYHVPKFEWDRINPKIVKCELCRPRLAKGYEPACTSVCPTHAVIFGPTGESAEPGKGAHRAVSRASTSRIVCTANTKPAARRSCICRTCHSKISACLTSGQRRFPQG